MDKLSKYAVCKFIKFVKNELRLSTPFKVRLMKTRDDTLKTYAYYDPNASFVKVYIKNRGMADVMRSICHELIHHKDKENGRIDGKNPDVGVINKNGEIDAFDIENRANSMAGTIVKKFGYANPKLAIYNKTF